jgi:hypothetical protein
MVQLLGIVKDDYNNNLVFLSQTSWGRLEMKPIRNKERRSRKYKNTKAQKEKGKIMSQAH